MALLEQMNNNGDSSPSSSSSSSYIAQFNEVASMASFSSSESSDSPNSPGYRERDLNLYLPLYQAVLKGDWDRALRFFQHDPDAIRARFGAWRKTALHIAVGTGHSIHFVEKLVDLMPCDAVALPDVEGYTALFDAAAAGNMEAAKLLVKKDPSLPNTWNTRHQLVPLHLAARCGHREMTLYLLKVTRDDFGPSPFAGLHGQKLLRKLIINGFHDVALDLVHRYPGLPIFRNDANPLILLAKRPSAFPSGFQLNFWQQIIYQCAPGKLDNFTNEGNGRAVENPIDKSHLPTHIYWWFMFCRGCQKMHALIWQVIGGIVPEVKHIQEQKVKHIQTLQLLKYLCMKATGLEFLRTCRIFKQPIVDSAIRGIPEIIEEIVELFPNSLWDHGAMQQDIFRMAIQRRHEKVFNLIYQVGDRRQHVTRFVDNSNNNILHLAGKLTAHPYQLGPLSGAALPQQLSLVSGAALQMQRELQWYKEVEKLVPANFKEMENNSNKTPKMVFSEHHKDLVKEGENWMKDRAKSYQLAAVLIAIIGCLAAVTIPCTKYVDGSIPSFKQNALKTFAISDTVSLLSSIASVIMFLSILSARFEEDDFLHYLPNMLMFGLVILLVSISSMMISLTAALCLVWDEQDSWFLILAGALVCLPVSLFVNFQFPLLVELIYSTYGPSIFCKQSNRVLY